MAPSTFLSRADRRADLVAIALLTMTVFLVFGNALQMGYMADDFDWMRQALSPDHALFDRITTAGSGDYFRPLVTLTFRLEQQLGAGRALFVHHLANLLFHLGSACLLYLAASSLSSDRKLAMALALVFLLHPLAVAPVYWLASRVDSLVTLFYLLSILGFLRLMAGSSPLLALLMVAGGAAAALLAKEMAITLPVVLLILWWWSRHTPAGQRAPARRPWLLPAWLATVAAAAVYILFLWLHIYRNSARGLPTFGVRSAGEALISGLLVLVAPNRRDYLVGVYYERPWLLPVALILLGGGALLLIAALRRHAGAQRPRLWPVAASALFLVSLLPLLPVGANSRRMHLPLALLCLVAALSTVALPRLRRPLLLLLAALLLPAALLSRHDGAIWLENWRLTQRYCRSFQEQLRAGEERAFLLLAVPGHARNTHLFANDANEALYHCIHGEFGQFSRFLVLGELRSQRALPAGAAVSQPAPGHFVVTPLDEDDFFVLWPDARENARYGDEQLGVTVDALAAPGRVQQFTVQADAAAFTDIMVLSFRGAEFYRLSAFARE